MLTWLQHRWTGLCLLILALGAFMLFLYGFFPLKYNSGKLAHMDDLPNFIDGVSIDGHEVYNSGENSVILMVIDGLRYDFVTEEYMPFTGQLLKNKSACIYVSIAEPPTVTMPRIKAMMTGSVSTFADVALNFGAPAVRGDSVLRVAAARGRRSVMYGDDTWLRLFPGLWAESDGTTSFYVTDFTEVDNNVTRHLPKILAPNEKMKPNFDFLVLHYLGLDHIGHVEGARSPKIKVKLLEMDDIVKTIHTAMNKWERNGVLIVCGDHGMRDAGGHGGASPAEVLVPLVLFKTNNFVCPHSGGVGPTVSQTDVAPSVAWLLNAPPPGDSSGRVLPALLPPDPRQHLYVLHALAHHLVAHHHLPTDAGFFKQYQRAEKQFAQFLATGQQTAAKIAKEYYDESLEAMSKYLQGTSVDFDMFSICVAILLLYCIGISILCVTFYSLQPDSARKTSVSHKHTSKAGTFVAFLVIVAICATTLTLGCFIAETRSQLCSFNAIWLLIFLLVACAFAMTYFITKMGIEKTVDTTVLKQLNSIDYLLIFGTLFHAWSFLGTSFIEEEHMTWYFFWNTMMFFILIRTFVVVLIYFAKALAGSSEVQEKPQIGQKIAKNIMILPKWILLIALHRYLRTMNQTGDRWLFLPDTADWLNAPENETILNIQLMISTLATCVICIMNLKHTNNCMYLHTVFTVLSTLCIFSYRINTKSLLIEAPDVHEWDPVHIVDVFWATLISQFVIEFISYVWTRGGGKADNQKFVYNKPKEKSEDYFYESMDEPWNLDEVKLSLARSLSHLMFNSLMLIVVLLMRPHNVIMVPSIYFTCWLTSKCMDHKLLDVMSNKSTEIVDVLSRTLVHLWIGYVFFFYQGNSNSLASVDLGAGYVGLREYSAARVALRVGLHAYAAPALAGAALYCALAASATSWTGYLQSVWRASNIYALHRVYTVGVYCAVAAAFRHHLFVWSVFSPKLLYDLAATVFTVQALVTIATIVLLTHLTGWAARTLVYRTRLLRL